MNRTRPAQPALKKLVQEQWRKLQAPALHGSLWNETYLYELISATLGTASRLTCCGRAEKQHSSWREAAPDVRCRRSS